MDLDFSEFHPLDHSLWECKGYPGGRRRHLRFRWDYQWSEELGIRWAHLRGTHDWAAYAYRSPALKVTAEPMGGRPWQYRAVCRGCSAEPDAETTERVIAAMKAHPLPFD